MRSQRVQLSRKSGFNLQAASRALNGLPAKKVDRSTDFGNPFKVRAGLHHGMLALTGPGLSEAILFNTREAAIDCAILLFKAWCPKDSDLATAMRVVLRGHNIACFCPIGAPCHGDHILEIINNEP